MSINGGDELPIYNFWADIAFEAFNYLKKYPKEEKFILADITRRDIMTIGGLIPDINEEFDLAKKVEKADQMSSMIKRVRADFKLGLRFGYIEYKQMQYICNKFIELGKMLGGWKKSFKPQSYYKKG